MKYMNDFDISDAKRRHAMLPVLSKAVSFLEAFKEEVNAHSDGWAYWKAPVKAADKLMTMIEVDLETGCHIDATEAKFRAALTPIKSFYTRRGNAAGMSYPSIERGE